MDNNQLIINDETGVEGLLMATSDSFCSMVPKTDAEKKSLFKAMNNPDKKVSDMINLEIELKDIYSEIVELADQKTGEVIKLPRIVLIDSKGIGYQCVSKGMFSALKKLFQIYGMPTWEKPIKIKIKSIEKASDRKVLTFDVI